jgi:hypothetical protein
LASLATAFLNTLVTLRQWHGVITQLQLLDAHFNELDWKFPQNLMPSERPLRRNDHGGTCRMWRAEEAMCSALMNAANCGKLREYD